jgi:hypothetical protein
VRSSLLIVITLAMTACADPVRDQEIAALGPETPGVKRGPLHRPGQPCLLCHDATGNRDTPFAVAGTVYATADKPTPLNNVQVKLTDSAGQQFTVRSNCAGNFYVSPHVFSPHYPLWVTVAAEDQSIDMESLVYRDGSCASCHTDPKNPSSAGHVFLLDDPTVMLPPGYYCQ